MSGRDRTTSSVDWSVDKWLQSGGCGKAQITGLGQTTVFWKGTQLRDSCCADSVSTGAQGENGLTCLERTRRLKFLSSWIYLSICGRNGYPRPGLHQMQVGENWPSFFPFPETEFCLISFVSLYCWGGLKSGKTAPQRVKEQLLQIKTPVTAPIPLPLPPLQVPICLPTLLLKLCVVTRFRWSQGSRSRPVRVRIC